MANLKFFTPDANKNPIHTKLMLANIEAIKALGGWGKAGDIRAFVIEKYNVSKKEQNIPQPSDPRSRLEYYLGIGREYLKRSGDLTKSDNNIWSLTAKGRGIENEIHTTASLTAAKETIRIDTAERRVRNRQQAEVAQNDETAIYGSWKSDLFTILQGMDGYAFERLCKHLLDEIGFINVKTNSKKGADGGIDGTGILRIKLISFHVYFQCKRWKGTVGVPVIRDFRGAMDGRARQGLVITTSRFTAPAIKEATRESAILIDLIDGDLLCDLLKEHNLGVTTLPDGQTNIDSDHFNTYNLT